VDYVDELTLVQSRGRVCGRFLNGQIAIAVNGDENVFYVNGSGGYPLWAHAATPVIVAHACAYRHSPTTAETVTWGMLRALHW
jgi:hypothetical protein